MILKIKVSPGAKQTTFAGEMANGTLKIRIKEAPEKSKANKALIDFLSGHLNIPKSKIKLISGQSSSLKTIKIPDA